MVLPQFYVEAGLQSLGLSDRVLFRFSLDEEFAAQAIARVAELGWRPVHILNSVANSVAAALKPAGFENANILTTAFLKDPVNRRQD